MKESPDLAELTALARAGGRVIKDLVNTRSQAFKKLQPRLAEMDDLAIADLIKGEPRIMVRPVLMVDDRYLEGFKEEEYQQIFNYIEQRL